jgi:hypothetical protein
MAGNILQVAIADIVKSKDDRLKEMARGFAIPCRRYESNVLQGGYRQQLADLRYQLRGNRIDLGQQHIGRQWLIARRPVDMAALQLYVFDSEGSAAVWQTMPGCGTAFELGIDGCAGTWTGRRVVEGWQALTCCRIADSAEY